mgnify:CR=1 FL=1
MPKKAKLLWMDLEMTGLDPEKDKILEVAVIATDWELNPMAQMTATVKVSEKYEETYQKLCEQNKAGLPVNEVEEMLLKFIDDHFGEEVYLAGNSIHQDKRFIVKEWPKLNERLHYRMLDVSAFKLYFENVMKKKFTKREMHLALDDILGSIEELKYYSKYIKK